MPGKLLSKPIFLCLFLFLSSLGGRSQDQALKKNINVVEIDPRQYVTVLYNRYRTREKLDTIWNWEQRKNVPNQKYNSLDDAGQVKIIFDKLGLIGNTDFFGNVTLEAEISGSKGTRPVEVNPYSEIGVARKAIGIKSDPPYDVSSKLLSLLAELSGVDTIRTDLENNNYSFRIRNTTARLKEVLPQIIQDCNRPNADIDSIKNRAVSAFQDFTGSNFLYSYYSLEDSSMARLKLTNNKIEIRKILSDLQSSSILSKAATNRDYFIITYKKAASYIEEELPLILEYLSSFEKGGQEGLKAFLSLTSLTLIKYNDIKNTLIRDEDTLATLHLPGQEDNPAITDSLLLRYKDPIDKAINSLYYLSRLQGSAIERIIINFVADSSSKVNNDIFDSFKNNYGKPTSNLNRKAIKDVINAYKKELSVLVAQKAGEQIYKKLITASIDLGKSGAVEGETLCLYLTWILDGSDSLQNSPRLEIGKYQIIRSGWGLEIADMFSLVNRTHPDRTIDPAHESPSVFKGAGGAVLMWTYSKEDKGLNIKKDGNDFYTRRKNVLMNFLQPSIGINVSYLDFNTSKDVEIGTGLQIGLFHNKIYFGYGANLNLLSPKDAPFYFFLGFSFAKLSDLFKDSNRVSSNQ